ncbi:hypothetical protein XM52_28290 [Roseovarius indicus]|uniref:Uncharacterized protein n=3 Tax=Roseovarius indicus TaxID=540747 RepID=A0A0T5NTI8_9RHOB|nr:hypothetical protein XM52_28290 [Roseovarius indicus]
MLLLARARQLIVSESDTGRVSIVDADNGETLDTFEICGDLHGVAAGWCALIATQVNALKLKSDLNPII